jgi:glycine reductase complex component B subunit gamma
MVKEIERAGIPVVHICTVTPISMTVGANRIVPAIAIPHPLGNPALDQEEEKKLRRGIVEKALEAFNFCEYSAANAFADATDVPFPTVV